MRAPDDEMIQRIIDEVMQPPEGLTLREQARWWAQNPHLLQIALARKALSPEIWAAILQVGKDVDLAHKIIDRKKVSGLTVEERGRIFELLTDGGVFDGSTRGRRENVARDIEIANVADEINDSRERNRRIREIAGDRYSKVNNNVAKLLKKAKAVKAKFDGYDEKLVRKILSVAENDLTEQELECMLKLFQHIQDVRPEMYEAFVRDTEK